MDIFDWYFKQIVTQGQMDWAFDRVQAAMFDISVGNAMVGIVDGLTVTEHSPTPDKTVDIAGPGTAYDKTGQRCHVPDALTVVDCSQDEFGTSSDPPTPTYERYISIFIRFDRDLTAPALDGNNITVYTRQLESFEIFVRLGAEAPAGTAVPAPIMADAELLVDILVTSGFTAIVDGDMDFTRREDWSRNTGSVIGDHVYGTARDAIDGILAMLDTWSGSLPFTFSEEWFGSTAVSGPTPPPTSVQSALDAIVYDLAQTGSTPAGAEMIGALDSPVYTYVTDWTDADVASVLNSLGSDLDAHIGGAAPQHPSSSISSPLISGSPESFSAGSVLSQLTEALGDINDRIETINPTASAATPVLIWRSNAKATDNDVDENTTSIYWMNKTFIMIQGAIMESATQVRAKNTGNAGVTMGVLVNTGTTDTEYGLYFMTRANVADETVYTWDDQKNWDSFSQKPVNPIAYGSWFPLRGINITRDTSQPSLVEYAGEKAINKGAGWGWTWNAYRDGSNWKNNSIDWSMALELSYYGLSLYLRGLAAAPGETWTSWDSVLEWGSALDDELYGNPEITGGVRDRVNFAMSGRTVGGQSQYGYVGVPWHSRVNGLLSGDVTITHLGDNEWTTDPTVQSADANGCFVAGSSNAPVSASNVYWRGFAYASI